MAPDFAAAQSRLQFRKFQATFNATILEESMRMVPIAIATGLAVFAQCGAGAAEAAEIRMLVTNAMKTTMEELEPQFEKASEHKLAITFGAVSELKVAIDKGAVFDVAILSPAVIEELAKGGKVSAASTAQIARAGFGIAARKGAPRPDVSTVEAFRRALLDAKSIAYVAAGAGSPYFLGLLDRLGIADQVKPKLKPQPTSNPTAKAVANGEAEIGITAISEILPYEGAQVAGPLPAEIQFYSVSAIGIAANARDPEAAKALVRFLTAPAAAAVLKAKGLEPG
jgi:molybdate transport system substrate-binding protein